MKYSISMPMLAFLAALAAFGQTKPETISKGQTMNAKGTFDVEVVPQANDGGAGSLITGFVLDKEFHGDLKAVSKGRMLAAGTEIEGSGAYTAFEQVTGSLDGKTGTFILQHVGSMRKGEYVMNVTVIPDSGTGELAGIVGTMKIIIEDGKHSYEFTYSFEEK